jgi:hypothetical protein
VVHSSVHSFFAHSTPSSLNRPLMSLIANCHSLFSFLFIHFYSFVHTFAHSFTFPHIHITWLSYMILVFPSTASVLSSPKNDNNKNLIRSFFLFARLSRSKAIVDFEAFNRHCAVLSQQLRCDSAVAAQS